MHKTITSYGPNINCLLNYWKKVKSIDSFLFHKHNSVWFAAKLFNLENKGHSLNCAIWKKFNVKMNKLNEFKNEWNNEG